MPQTDTLSERLLVLAPIGRDGELITSLALSRGFEAEDAKTLDVFLAEFQSGIGAAVITEEALHLPKAEELIRLIEDQPEWSDVPFVVIASRADAEERARRTVLLLKPLRNVTLIERPVRPSTTASAFEAALRDRRRQYALRQVIEAHASAENALAESERQLKTALLAAGLGTWRIDVETNALECSDTFRAIIGLPAGMPLTYNDVLQCVHPDDRQATAPIILNAIANHSEFQVEYRVLWRDESQHWVLVRGRAFRDEDDRLLVSGVTMDITDRKLAFVALKDSEQRYRQLSAELEVRVKHRTEELMAANSEMEGFTYSVSHDLRAPLRAIATTSMIIKEDYGNLLPPPALEQLERQAAASKKLAALIDDLLHLSRLSRQEMRRTKINVSAIAKEITDELCARGLPCEFKFEIEPEIIAEGDPTLVRFALLNLLENAVKFSPKGGEIHVGVSGSNGSRAIFVRDQGIGFDPQYAGKVFQPFERLVTDKEFPGTGIGLANVQRIVHRHGGRIWVESEPDRGTTFFFTL